MEKFVEKYQNLKTLKKICTDNKVDYSNYKKGKVSVEKKLKVENSVKKEISKMIEGVLYG